MLFFSVEMPMLNLHKVLPNIIHLEIAAYLKTTLGDVKAHRFSDGEYNI